MNLDACALCPAIILKKYNGRLDISNYAQVAFKMIRGDFKTPQRLIVGFCNSCFHLGIAFDARNFVAIETSVRDGWEKELESIDGEGKKDKFRRDFYRFNIIGLWDNGKEKSSTT